MEAFDYTRLTKSDFGLTIQPESVLIIEDAFDTANYISYLISTINPQIKVSIVNDPFEAALAISDTFYDLLLVDQNLFGVNGTTVLKQVDSLIDSDPIIIDSDRFYDSVPVVVMSADQKSLSSVMDEKYNHFKIYSAVNKKNITRFLENIFSKNSKHF